MGIDTGGERIDEKRRLRRQVVRLIPRAKSWPANGRSVHSSSQESAGSGAPREEKHVSRGPQAKTGAAQSAPRWPLWLGRPRYYGLALLFVAVAAALRWAFSEVLSPTPFFVFYLAWVGAAAFGGLGPGGLATVLSWLCVDFLFDPTPGHMGFDDPMSVVRLLTFLAGGLVVSVVGEKMRRSRIRERRQTEELAAANAALRESEFHLAQAQQMAHLGSWSWDLVENRLYWSDEIYRLYGLQPGESEPRPEDFLGFVHPEDRPRVEQCVREALVGGGSYRLDFRIIQRGGQEQYVHCEAQIALDREGHPVKAEGTLQDITERRQAEETLRRSEERFHQLFEDDLTGNFISTPEGEILLCNPAFARTFGFARAEEAVGTNIVDLYPDPRERQPFLERLKKEGRIERLEVWRKRRDGEPIFIVENVVGQFDEQGGLYEIKGYLFEDTQRKRAEDALRELNATLESRGARRTAELEQRARQLQKLTLELTEAEERERKRLAEILHDDLQQVLAAAKLQVGLLSSRVRNDPESREIAEQAKDLLGDAAAKSRSLSRELSAPVLSRSDLGEAFEWLAEQMQTQHGLTVHLDMGERLELASEPLRVLLYKAAQELLFNASKHAGVHEAKLRLRRRRGRLRLLVSDAGRGFDPAEPGFNLGFGLLSIRERVEHLGGRMKIRSAAGKGSIFVITVSDAEGSP